MRAAIVAGGLGTRAEGMTGGRIPKALLPVGGVPIIFRQMRALRQEGVTRIDVLAGHLGDQLAPALAPEAAALGLQLEIIVEDSPLGTAGCLSALEASGGETLLVYGDMLFDMALAPLYRLHRSQQALLTIVAHPNDHPRTSDLIVEADGLVKAILPRAQPRSEDYRNLVPAGLYLASPAFFAEIERGTKADMINDVLPRLVGSGARIAAYNTPEYLRDVGTPARHALAERDLASGRVEAMKLTNPRPALFFDCDGVLNDEPGLQGAVTPDDVKLLAGAGGAVRRAREAGRLTVAVTNRPQVAKGFVTFEGLDHILGRLEALLAMDGGVLDRIYFCPHHPEAGFRRRDSRAEDPLRMSQARHADAALGLRRSADRSAPFGADRRQPARHRCRPRRRCLGLWCSHRPRLPRPRALPTGDRHAARHLISCSKPWSRPWISSSIIRPWPRRRSPQSNGWTGRTTRRCWWDCAGVRGPEKRSRRTPLPAH